MKEKQVSPVLIIIPAYNESGNIVKTVTSIQKETPDFDYVIINDCSTDSTKAVCQAHGFNLIDLPINLGIGGAVQTGYRYAADHHYAYAVQVDGDGQHNPAFIRAMLDKLEAEQLDMVIGSRFIDKEGFQSSFARRIGISFFEWLIRLLTGKTITDPTSGLRLVNRRVIDIFASHYPNDFPEPETTVALLAAGYQVGELPVLMNEREAGVSSITVTKSVYYMFKVSLAMLLTKLTGGYKHDH